MIEKIREYSIPLIAGVVIALVWANINFEGYEHMIHLKLIPGTDIDFHFLINDVFMYFFFATAGIEIVHSVSPGGVLNPISKAVTPLVATLGGVLGPIVVFFILNALIGDPSYASGWGIGTATDIALAWLLARIVFGAHHPAVNFLLLLAVADDAIGLIIIAIFYPDPDHPPQYIWLLLVAAGILLAFLFKKFGVKKWWIYFFVAGAITWYGMYKTGVHPSLASVLIVPFIPHGHSDDIMEKSEPSSLDKLEHSISDFVTFGLIFFGITNAGVKFSQASILTLIVFLSLIIGKTAGITLFTKFSTSVLKSELPKGMYTNDVIVAGFVAGMGLTVALYIAGSAFTEMDLQCAAKMGALLSASVFLIAPIWGKILKVQPVTLGSHVARK